MQAAVAAAQATVTAWWSAIRTMRSTLTSWRRWSCGEPRGRHNPAILRIYDFRPSDVVIELGLLVLDAGPATMRLNWDFTVRWFASFGSLDQCQPEQRRNSSAGMRLIATAAWCSSPMVADHLGVNEWHRGRYWPLVQLTSLLRSHEVGC